MLRRGRKLNRRNHVIVHSGWLVMTLIILMSSGNLHGRQMETSQYDKEKINQIRKEVETSPTDESNFDERLRAAKLWIRQIIRQVSREEMFETIPPERTREIIHEKMEGNIDHACRLLDKLFQDLESIDQATSKTSAQGKQITSRHTQAETFQKSSLKETMVNIQVDYGDDQGEISPCLWELMAPFTEGQWKQLKDIGVDTVQIIIMPFNLNFPVSGRADADPGDPKEYDFSEIDQTIGYAVKNEIEVDLVFFGMNSAITTKDASRPERRGRPFRRQKSNFEPSAAERESPERRGISPRGTMSPPANYEQYGEMVKHIMMHFSQGWANGYHWKISTARLWREPDRPSYWTGTAQEFYQLYKVWVNAVKSVVPDIAVGAGGFAQVLDAPRFEQRNGQYANSLLYGYPKLGEFISGFLEYCEKNNLPLDLLVWDAYSPFPYVFYLKAKIIGDLLDKYPNLSPFYGKPISVNDQWNMHFGSLWSGVYHKSFDTAQAAAHNISSIIYMLNAGTSRTIRVGGFTKPGGKGGIDFTITNSNDEPKPVYFAYKAIAMMKETPIRIKSIGTDEFGFTVLAGKSNDSDRINIVISNFNIFQYITDDFPNDHVHVKMPGIKGREANMLRDTWDHIHEEFDHEKPVMLFTKYSITIKNLPWNGKTIDCERYLVDNTHKLDLVEKTKLIGSEAISFSNEMSVPSVQLIKLNAK